MLDESLKIFFLTLESKPNNIKTCENIVREAISKVAKDFFISKFEIILSIPKTKYYHDGLEYNEVLYDNGEASNETYEKEDFFEDGGKGKIIISLNKGYDKSILDIICSTIFKTYTLTFMNQILNYIMDHDLDTACASHTYLMKYIVSLIKSNRLDNYNIYFFNTHNFKYVNKIFSYQEGDIVLFKYTSIVKSILLPDELLARLGGDNFVSIVRKENHNKFVEFISNLTLTHKNDVKEQTFIFGATTGCAPLDGITNPRDAMGRCSIAYQKARKVGAGSLVIFSNEIREEIMHNQSVLSNFKQAIQNREFVVYYQPKVNIKDNSFYGAEALVRWIRQGRLVPPMEFIPLLEQDGSICALDFYVLDSVCKFLRDRLDKGLEALTISVNFSRKHLDNENLVDDIVRVIDKYNLDHKYIEIELTESEDYQNYETIASIVNHLRSHNISTSMDDFGTGYSSLNMIKEVDIKVIKIDKSFIPFDNSKNNNFVMFKSIVNLVKELGKKVVAEGVETKEQLKYIKDAGCEIVQGYIYDKPLPEVDFTKRLQNGYNN